MMGQNTPPGVVKMWHKTPPGVVMMGRQKGDTPTSLQEPISRPVQSINSAEHSWSSDGIFFQSFHSSDSSPTGSFSHGEAYSDAGHSPGRSSVETTSCSFESPKIPKMPTVLKVKHVSVSAKALDQPRMMQTSSTEQGMESDSLSTNSPPSECPSVSKIRPITDAVDVKHTVNVPELFVSHVSVQWRPSEFSQSDNAPPMRAYHRNTALRTLAATSHPTRTRYTSFMPEL